MDAKEMKYYRSAELRHGLDCFPYNYDSEDYVDKAVTRWSVGGTMYEYMEEPYTGRTAFVAWDVSPDWAITLSME